MKERPIIFSAPMVRAILEGRKTQTRRVVKPQGSILTDRMARSLGVQPPPVQNSPVIPCPYGQPGDRLWVRETFSYWLRNSDRLPDESDYEAPWYRADADAYGLLGRDEYGPVYAEQLLWKPSIYMPRTASRILLEVVSVRVERLQEISEDDCLAEGIAQIVRESLPGFQQCGEYDVIDIDPAAEYLELWESINGHGSWHANPWVWVVEFKVIGRPA